jgi:hypothetical protein
MVQTSFSVADETDLTTDLASISVGGGNAAIDTAYTITLTAPITLTGDAVADLESGSTLLLEGDRLLANGNTFTVTGGVTTDLNFTGVITLLDGGSVDNPAVTTSGGTPITGIFTGQITDSGAGDDSVINAGSITYTGTGGAIDFSAGTSTVTNTGTIDATNALGVGVSLNAGTVTNGTTADMTALIQGGDDGIDIADAGDVVNDGTIIGQAANGVNLGSGTVVNGTTADTTALIQGNADNGVLFQTGAGTVDNFGTITSNDVGIDLQAGGTVTQGSSADTGAQITGAFEGVLIGQYGSSFSGSVFNYATITANGSDLINAVIGVYAYNGGTVENIGSLSSISAVDLGVGIAGSLGYVQNAGSIVASGAESFGVALGAGGTVINGLTVGSAALIQGGTLGVQILAGASGSGALVDNDGTIIGEVGVDFLDGGVQAASGTVVNDGLIESTVGVSPYAVTFGDGEERLVLDPDGAFVGAVLGGQDTGDSTTLELGTDTTGTLEGLGNDAGTVIDTAGTFTFSFFNTIDIDAGAAWTITDPGSFPTAEVAGQLTVDSGASVTSTLLQSGGTVTLLGTATAAQTIQFALDDAETLALAAPTAATPDAVQADITDFGLNGTIDLLNISNSTITELHYQSSTLYVLDNTTTLAALDLPGPFFSNDFANAPDNGAGTFITTDVMPCFAAGTAIRTTRGEIRVQDLRVGDRVVCAGGGVRPVVWIGRRFVDVARHPSPAAVAPVRVRPDAFADGVPRRDLLLSPDHAVYVDGVLIPVKHLVNGHSVAVAPLDAVEYWHVELDRHDVLFAEGLPAESFLDTGNRGAFANHNGVVMMHPCFDRSADALSLAWEAAGYAPLVVDGDEIRRVRHRLALRMGGTADQPVDPDVYLAAGSVVLRPLAGGDGCKRFHLPRGIGEVVIHSRAAAPAGMRAWMASGRRMGVPVSAARFLAGDGTARQVPLASLDTAAGWHPLEVAGGRAFRWTDGAARLTVPAGAFWLELQLLAGSAPALAPPVDPPRAIA